MIKTLNSFIEKATKIHNSKYSYEKFIYINSDNKSIIICPIHNEFLQSAHRHLLGQGCKQCAIEKKKKHKIKKQLKQSSIKRPRKLETTILELEEKHPNLSFEKFTFKVVRDYSIATCKIHGDFSIRVNNILYGKGCPKCGLENQGWNKNSFVKRCKNGTGIFYILRCFNETESFYKIGITSQSIKKRYSNKKDLQYNYEIILEVTNDPIFIWNLELEYKRKLKNHKYYPLIPFAGSITECFSTLEA